MAHQKAAKEYPTGIFSQTTPDETQELEGNLRFSTWYKGWLTRSRIYERKLPDTQEVGALRLDGPGDSFMSIRHDGSLRIMTGVKDQNKGPQSGMLGIRTWGQQQLHNNRSNLQYCAGDDEEGQALNVLCYGDYVENSKGGTRYVYATKIILDATAELILKGGSVKIQSDGDIEMAAASITTAQVNKKDVVLGQKKTTGAGENTTEQFDPRSTTVINTPGSLQWNVAQDYQQIVGGVYKASSFGGPGGLIADRSFSMNLKTKRDFSAGGIASTGIYSKGSIEVSTPTMLDLAGTSDVLITSEGTMDISATDLNITGANTTLEGTAQVEVKSNGNVKITGALIYLN
tara:strand:- start:51 stop:1085 length:1035 start_codon:yes stop_codon:yes gene_type:complete